MSGVVKAVKKVFKPIVKVVKKIAVPLLIAGAVILTGGAALGVLPAVGTVLGSIGISGTLGTVLTGAVTSAGWGAVIGGATSALTGGSFMDGVKQGALVGGITGAATGLLAPGIVSNIPGATPSGAAPAPVAAPVSTSGGSSALSPVAVTAKPIPTSIHAPVVGPGAAPSGSMASRILAAPSSTSSPSGFSISRVATTPGPASTSGSGGFLGTGGWLERNQYLAGTAVSGLGQGLLASAGADNGADERRYQRENYDTGGSEWETRGRRAEANVGSGSARTFNTAEQRPVMGPAQQKVGGTINYDPASGKYYYQRPQVVRA